MDEDEEEIVWGINVSGRTIDKALIRILVIVK